MPNIDFVNLAQLHKTAFSQKIDEDIISSINPSTLGLKTLQIISAIMDHIMPSFILEFGSGLSTLFFSRALKGCSDAAVFSVDNSEFYLNKTKEAVSGRSNIKLFCCPIKPYQFKFKRFLTYDTSYLNDLPQGKALDLILIDGPLGHRYGREAVLYQIAPFFSSETLILLDDANREPEQTAIANWHKVWGDAMEVIQFPELKKGLAVLKIKEPFRQNWFPFSAREISDSWYLTKRIQREDENRLPNED